ncbi:MAG TPA: metallophosphoesterase [Burkholderiaceae bacterium]
MPVPSVRPLRHAVLCLAAFLLTACGSLQWRALGPDDSHFVVLGDGGAIVARAITRDAECPLIRYDYRVERMNERMAPASLPQRSVVSEAEFAKPSDFPVRTCEAQLPPGTSSASIKGHALPMPVTEPKRLVVIGDTGCRLQRNSDRTKPGTYQDCNDPAAFPFAAIAAKAAEWKPDLVIHLGDYHYRENACPADRPGCAGSPWGYGWDTWREDFFRPAAPLLRAAPWVVTRGNHESCYRGGQGWWRFLDPRALLKARDCNDPVYDYYGDYSDPYAVPMGDGAQLLVLDTSNALLRALPSGEYRAKMFRDTYIKTAQLGRSGAHNIALTHHALLGFYPFRAADGSIALDGGNASLLSVFSPISDGLLLPPTVDVLLSGHTHAWQQVSFSTPHATQFISGFSGTSPDTVPLPMTVPPGSSPAPGAIAERVSSWTGGFGYMTMEKHSAGRWSVTVFDTQGAVKNRCLVDGKKSVCDVALIQ